MRSCSSCFFLGFRYPESNFPTIGRCYKSAFFFGGGQAGNNVAECDATKVSATPKDQLA